jgi:hypothetical protein
VGKRKSEREEIWQYRQMFFTSAQGKIPAIGRYLRRYGSRTRDAADRAQVISKWQAHFNLPYSWAHQCAVVTLASWDRCPDKRESVEWFAGPSALNLAEEDLQTFEFKLVRQFFPGTDLGWFKQSMRSIFEAELELFSKRVGAKELGCMREPKELTRAFECLALRVCKGISPSDIAPRPEYSRDWSTISRDLKAAAELIGIKLPRPGRPRRNIAR